MGRRISKARLFGDSNYRHTGLCVVRQMEDRATHRAMTIARFGDMPDADGGLMLYDARLVWFEPDAQNFMLTGFERVQVRSEEVEYAQSWLVYIDKAPAEPQRGMGLSEEARLAMTERELKRFYAQR